MRSTKLNGVITFTNSQSEPDKIMEPLILPGISQDKKM